MRLRTVGEIKTLAGKRVLLRVDFNVPILSAPQTKKQNRASRLSAANVGISNDTKIKAALPTIEYLLNKGAKVILISHLGRPKIMQNAKCKMQNCSSKFKIIKKANKHLSLSSIAKYLDRLIGNVEFIAEAIDSEQLKNSLKKIKIGTVAVLENIRFYPGEEKNDPKFAKELAGLADLYVNDAFAVSHRAHASTVGVTKYLPSYAGLLLEKEIKALGVLLHKPKKPFIALLGGAKISDKIGMIKNLLKRADQILIGGAMANNFYKAMGKEVGASLVEAPGVKMAKELLKFTSSPARPAAFRLLSSLVSKRLILPVDFIVGGPDGKAAKVANITKEAKAICKKPFAIFDIGPKTILEYAKWIKKAQTLVWNGPMGLFEVKQYSHGTMSLGRLFAAHSKGKAFGVAGGGETVEALHQTGMEEYVDWVSTGGGAMLEFLEGKTLPGIKALVK